MKYTKELDLTIAQLSELVKLSNKKEQLLIHLKQTLVSTETVKDFYAPKFPRNKCDSNQK